MILIAHRGNINGANYDFENNPNYIDTAIQKGFDVEVDVRVVNNEIFLGHDDLNFKINPVFLLERKQRLWVHCKNRDAISMAIKLGLNFFWHQEDDYTLTSYGYVWAYPGLENIPDSKTILVMPEKHWNLISIKNFTAYGVCSDIVSKIKEKHDSLVQL